MNALQIAPTSGFAAPVNSSGGHSPTGEASTHVQTPVAAPAPPPPPPPPRAEPPPVVSNGPRFDRQTGFIPGTLKVYVDLVDPQNAELSYRIYGPRGGTTAATDAYARGDETGRAKQDLAVA